MNSFIDREIKFLKSLGYQEWFGRERELSKAYHGPNRWLTIVIKSIPLPGPENLYELFIVTSSNSKEWVQLSSGADLSNSLGWEKIIEKYVKEYVND